MTIATTTVTADELEAMAYATGREITLAPDRAVLSIGGVIFVAPLISAQRQPEIRQSATYKTTPPENRGDHFGWGAV